MSRWESVYVGSPSTEDSVLWSDHAPCVPSQRIHTKRCVSTEASVTLASGSKFQFVELAALTFDIKLTQTRTLPPVE